jgi:peptide/nickel transport system permease protein
VLTFVIRRLLLAIPTLVAISLVIFLLLALAPGDPTAQLPLTVPPEVREQIRQSLGLGEPVHIRYLLWLKQIVWVEPLHAIDALTGSSLAPEGGRLISFQTRSPVMDIVVQRLPQTLWVVGLAYVVGVLIALPIGILSAYKQYSTFDQAGTFLAMIGFSVPPFFTGLVAIVVFSVWLGWFPSVYDTTLVVNSWDTFRAQLAQMIMPVMVLAVQTTAQISRFMRSAMLDNLGQDYVRTARAKGLRERDVVLSHVTRNSMIPVVTVIALGAPGIFAGAIVTEQVFKVNGLGQLLITSIQASDVPMVQTLAFVFAVLIVLFNLIADVLYGVLDPRIRYD